MTEFANSVEIVGALVSRRAFPPREGQKTGAVVFRVALSLGTSAEFYAPDKDHAFIMSIADGHPIRVLGVVEERSTKDGKRFPSVRITDVQDNQE